MRQARVSTLVDGLKLHSTPSYYSKVIDIAAPGDVVQVLDEIATGRWTQVLYKGQRGYMGSTFLMVEEPAPSPVIEPVEPTPPDYGPPMWMFIAGVATLVLGFIGAVAIVLR